MKPSALTDDSLDVATHRGVPTTGGAQLLLTREKATHLTKLFKQETYGVSGAHSSLAAAAIHLTSQLKQQDVEQRRERGEQVTRQMEVGGADGMHWS